MFIHRRSRVAPASLRRLFELAISATIATIGAVGCSERTAAEGAVGAVQSPMGLGFGGGTATSAPGPLPSLAVDGFGRFKSPTRLAMGQGDILYVVDTSEGVVAKHKLTGERVGTLTGLKRPLGVGLFENTGASVTVCVVCSTHGVARLARGCERGWSGLGASKRPLKVCHVEKVSRPRVYVGDAGDGSVRIFEGDVMVGALGQGEVEFTQPNAITVTSDGVVYVVDSAERVVKAYDQEGHLTATISDLGDGTQLGFPTDVAANEALGELYVSDFNARRVVVFTLSGAWVRNIEAPPNDQGDPIFFRPAGLGITPTGNLLVVDNALGAVAVITPAGALLSSIGYREGRYWTGDLSLPIDAVSDGKRIYVTSNQTGRVGVFEVAQ